MSFLISNSFPRARPPPPLPLSLLVPCPLRSFVPRVLHTYLSSSSCSPPVSRPPPRPSLRSFTSQGDYFFSDFPSFSSIQPNGRGGEGGVRGLLIAVGEGFGAVFLYPSLLFSPSSSFPFLSSRCFSAYCEFLSISLPLHLRRLRISDKNSVEERTPFGEQMMIYPFRVDYFCRVRLSLLLFWPLSRTVSRQLMIIAKFILIKYNIYFLVNTDPKNRKVILKTH